MSVGAVPAGSGRVRGFALILSVLILAEVVSAFELSMMYVALPTLIRDFQTDASTVAWVVTAYLLVSASCAALGGRLGDMYGRRRVMLVVLALATIGSVVSLIGGSLAMVILGRGIQGATGAVMPLAFGLARQHLRGPKVSVGLSMIGSSALIAGALGALVAGLVIDAFTWHAIFVCAAVLGVAGFLAVWAVIPRDPRVSVTERVDIVGAILLPVAVTGLLMGISVVGKAGPGSASFLVPMAVALAVGAVWVWWELRVPSPIVNVRMLANRHIALTVVVTFVAAIGPVGGSGMVQSMLAQYPASPVTQVGLGLTPGQAGAISAVAALLGFLASPIGGVLSRTLGGRFTFALGVVLLTLPAVGMLLTYGSLPLYIVLATIQALGISLFYGALPNVLFEAVPESHSSEATGTNTMIRNVGQSTAAAIVAAVLASNADPKTHLTSTQGFSGALIMLAVLGTVAFVLALFLRRSPEQWVPRGVAAEVADARREAGIGRPAGDASVADVAGEVGDAAGERGERVGAAD